MKKFLSARFARAMVLASAMTFAGMMPAYAVEEGDEPMIVFHTDILNQTNAGSVFTIALGAKEDTYVDVDFGYGPVEQEVKEAVFDTETMAVKGTYITCTASPEGIVKIYGDPKLIDFLDVEGCYIDEISFPELTEVEILNVGYNLLKGLDLSHMKKAQALYLSANPYNETPLIVGDDKPNLALLEMAMVENVDPNFDITTYPKLVSLSAYSTPTLTHIDPTNCPDLVRLSIDVTGVSTIDVSKNPHLRILNVSQTDITSFDVTNNPELQELYCSNNGQYFSDTKISELDLTKNPYLTRLFCAGNNLTSLDVSNNPFLTDLSAAHNSLSALNLDNNLDIYNLDLMYNNMDFVTLPEPRFSEYYYIQNSMPVNSAYKVGDVIDLSARVLRPRTQTSAKLCVRNRLNPSELIELSEDYYSYDAGKVTLKKEYNDSVYVAFTNNLFTDGVLSTTNFMVKTPEEFGKPSPVVKIGFSSAATNVEMSVGIAGASLENPVTFFVDFGDGKMTEFTATSSTLPAEPNVAGRRAGAETIIYLSDDDFMTAFGVSRGRIASSDFSNAPQLQELVINGCQMPSIDLAWNNKLRYINLDNNSLTSLNLAPANATVEKIYLTEVSAANNRISYFLSSTPMSYKKINLSGNQLSGFDVSQMYALEELNLSDNNLSGISLAEFEYLTTLDISHNHVTELLVPPYTPLEAMDISYNDFTFASLPAVGEVEEYTYAPQNPVTLPTKAPSVNLSDYLFTDEAGQSTSFVWRTVEGDKILTDDQISQNGGMFKFLDTEMGEVYCSMTHPAFPAFEGENVYKTSDILAADLPDNVFASFTTIENATASMSLAGLADNTVVYIDWAGNGELEQYILGKTYTAYSVNTVAGAEVKCYSYEEEEGLSVFSFDGVKVSALDASKMRHLNLFAWDNGGLSDADYTLPVCPTLNELRLVGNGLTEQIDLAQYPHLDMLNLSNNNLETLDIRGYDEMVAFYASGNKLKDVKFDNASIWDLGLSQNELESVDLSGLPSLSQLAINNNRLSTLNLDGLTGLKVIHLPYNYFTIATLPLQKSSWYVYNYSNQNPVEIMVKDGDTVDLSSQASRDGYETEYRWFVGSPWFDENGDLVGDELVAGEDFSVENGVTTFLKNYDDLMCIMINPLFPDLYLYTYLVDVTGAAVEEVGVDAIDADAEYYDLSGVRVANPANGIFIRRQGDKFTKVLIK